MKPERICTYRIQLRPGFGFEQARKLLPYLSKLGISHVYTSPYLQAVAGSEHGYDVADPSRVNEELGGASAHVRFCRAMKKADLGHMIDVVPNHMAIAGQQNPWWWDVLENGPSSPYATFFDVDWEASEERWPNKILLPVLGDHYGRVLEDGQFTLKYNQGIFTLHYYEHVFPIDPSSLYEPLQDAYRSCGYEALAFLSGSCSRLPRPTVTAREAVERRHRDKAVLVELLDRLYSEEPDVAAAIDEEVQRINADPDAMDRLIDNQNYRLSLWKTAGRDLGYRRFFDIQDLAGLRAEDPEVFYSTHDLPLRWVKEEWVQGLRIDHPDGLRNPYGYFQRLRSECPQVWIVAEKILEPGESLPEDWPVEGTTGYDFLNLCGGLFIDPKGEGSLTDFYTGFTGETSDFEELVRDCKRQVLRDLLGSELNRLTALFVDVCEHHRRHRDYTRYELQEALQEVAACFPVYRTYARGAEGVISDTDWHYISEAIACASSHRDDLDPELFEFLKSILTLRVSGTRESELVMRFQQLTGPAMAKGVEDTAFYRFNRFVALNEVGGDPAQFGKTPEGFHQSCIETLAKHPFSAMSSSTHDTKRSEDVRARLAVLSEIPQQWTQTVINWSAENEQYRAEDIPDRNTEYLFYQTLVGAWPIEIDRMTGYMEKAIREAKTHTSWTNQDEEYEQGVLEFVGKVMRDKQFMASVEGFISPLVLPGRINSIAQTLLKLTVPGIPDVYQGCELWDHSLVDPDNRRPVDFSKRAELLAEMESLSAEAVMERMDEGLPKMWTIHRTLRLRGEHPGIFGPQGSYEPLECRGEKARHTVAFIRGGEAIILVPRLIIGLNNGWKDTTLELPKGKWLNMMTDEYFDGGSCLVRDLLNIFPVALLKKEA